MRKDVKFGLTIGGILLIVLVVYVLVITRGTDRPLNTEVTLVPGPTEAAIPVVTPVVGNHPAETHPRIDTSHPAVPHSDQSHPDQSHTDQSHTDGSHADASHIGAPAPATPPVVVRDPQPQSIFQQNSSTTQPTDVAGAKPDQWDIALHQGLLSAPATPESGSMPGNDGSSAGPMQVAGSTPAGGTTSGGSGSTGVTSTDTPLVSGPVAMGGTTPNPIVSEPMPTPQPHAVRPATQPISGQRTHAVAKGETLSTISIAAYGSAKYWKQIATANPTINPDRLKIGAVIVLPTLATQTAAGKPTAGPDGATGPAAPSHPVQPPVAAAAMIPEPGKEYQIQSGDSLYKIAKKAYNNGQMADKIYELNKAIIGDNPAKLKLGTIIKLPPAV